MSQKDRMKKMLEAIWQASKCANVATFPDTPGSFTCPLYTVEGAEEQAWEKGMTQIVRASLPKGYRFQLWGGNIQMGRQYLQVEPEQSSFLSSR